MTRRPKARSRAVDPDDFGFELVGDEFNVQPQELMCLIGLTSLARDLYFLCLRPFADPKSGDVYFASTYRFIQRLTPSSSTRGGPRLEGPNRCGIQRALASLAEAGLIELFSEEAKARRALQIRVKRRFGVVSTDSVASRVRRKAGSSQTRMNARLKAELATG